MPARKLLLGFATIFACGFLNASGRAANINVTMLRSNEEALVTISGGLEIEDIERFRAATSPLAKAIVALASPGGSLRAGIEIGTQIRLKGFTTLVPDGVVCASACGIAWLGGVKRLMGPSAKVGFHAAYIVQDGVETETSVGNALAGAYFNRIGLPDRAIVYLTQAAPRDINFLTFAQAAALGIDVEPFSLNVVAGTAAAAPAGPESHTQDDAPELTVRQFYEALGDGDGARAAAMIVPEKRVKRFAPEAMTRFFGSLAEPLRLISVTSKEPQKFVAEYTYRAAKRECNGVTEVSVQRRQDRWYIESIKSMSGC